MCEPAAPVAITNVFAYALKIAGFFTAVLLLQTETSRPTMCDKRLTMMYGY